MAASPQHSTELGGADWFLIAVERMMCSAHREHRGTGGIALVEDEDLRAAIAAELERDQRQ